MFIKNNMPKEASNKSELHQMLNLLQLPSKSCIENLVYHLTRSYLQDYTMDKLLEGFAKSSVVDVRQGSEYACLCHWPRQLNWTYVRLSCIILVVVWTLMHFPFNFFVNWLSKYMFKNNLRTKSTRKAARCNNRDDSLHLSFTLKISVAPTMKLLWRKQ